jgi:hypothetical protein
MKDQGRRLEPALLLLLLLVWLATWLPRLRGPIDLRWDAAVYYTLGTSLAEGKGYRLLNEPGEIASVGYPPGLPAIVAVHQWMLDTADPVAVGVALRRFYFAISGLYVFAVYWLLRRPFGPFAASLGAAVCALSMTLVWVSDRAYSDLPFLLATTSFLLLARQSTWAGRAGAGAAAALAFLLRTVGAALLIAWVAEPALARQWRRLATRLLVTLLLIGTWQGYVWKTERSPDYLMPAYPYQRAPYLLYNVSYRTYASLERPFFPDQGYVSRRDLAIRVLTNLSRVPVAVGEVLSASSDDWYSYLERFRSVPVIGLVARWRSIRAALTLLGLLTLAGLWVQLRQRDVRIPLILVIYLAGVCAMTLSEEFGRYLSGIQPLLVALLFTTLLLPFGSRGRGRSLRAEPVPESVGRTRQALFGVIVSAIVVGQVTTLAHAYTSGMSVVTHRQWRGHDVSYRLFSYDGTFSSFDGAIDWVSDHTKEDEVVASSQPHWVYVRAGRRAVMPPFERDLARQQALLDSVPVAYVIVDSNGFSATREYSLPALRNEQRWERVYRSPDGTTEVYKRRREPSGS